MKELKFLFALFRYFIPMKTNKKLIKGFQLKENLKRFIMLIILIVVCYDYIIDSKEIISRENIFGPLMLTYSIAITARILIFTITPLYLAEEYYKLWNRILNVKKYCEVLKIKNSPEIKFNLTVVCILQTIISICSFWTAFQLKSGFQLILALVLFLTKAIFSIIASMKQLILLTLIKNYFKQINDLIKTVLTNNVNSRKKKRLLLEIFKFHQELYDLINFTNTLFAINIILEYSELFIIMVSHVHNIIIYNILGYAWFSTKCSFSLIFYSTCSLFLPIVVAHKCTSQVN